MQMSRERAFVIAFDAGGRNTSGYFFPLKIMPKPVLGKGLGALIGKSGSRAGKSDSASANHRSASLAPLKSIVPSPLQPRTEFEPEQLQELVDSIREHGIIQPLIVREVKGKLELIAGERRWRAATALGLEQVPVRIVEVKDDRQVLEMALIENLQREDLNPIEEAQAYVRLAREFDMRQEDIAKRVGKNRATVANAMRLLDLSSQVQALLSTHQLTTGHAKVILGVKSKSDQKLLALEVVKKGLTVRATERLVSQHLNPNKASKKKKLKGDEAAAIEDVQNRLRERFATEVNIAHSKDKGKIEIHYYGNDDLNRILDLLGVND
ncbi:MAG: ParB family chromosome partitioning protein [Verrucomicrobiales bacterium]|jgi:ParB family chromosome partitioning protein